MTEVINCGVFSRLEEILPERARALGANAVIGITAGGNFINLQTGYMAYIGAAVKVKKIEDTTDIA